MSEIAKSSSFIFHSILNKCVQSTQDIASKFANISSNINNNIINIFNITYSYICNIFAVICTLLLLRYLFKQDACLLDDSKNKRRDERPNSEELKEENTEFKNKKENNGEIKNKKENNQDADTVIGKAERRQSNKHVSILTWQNHGQSMYRRRTSTNNKQCNGSTEADFQNEIFAHFRTKSTKKNKTSALINLSKLMQNLQTVSPALVQKNGTVTVLSQKKREKVELEETKKRQIKTKPISPSVLRGPCESKIAKKPTNTASAIQPECGDITYIISSFLDKNSLPPARHDKTLFDLENMVPKTVNDSGSIVKHKTIHFDVSEENSVAKNARRVQKCSFEARNKNVQMKKQQRSRSLQEVNKVKVEFHARSMPNLSEPAPRKKTNAFKTENKKTQKMKNAAGSVEKTSLKKIHPPELNTDKRMKELRRFEKKFKFFKEIQEDASERE